MDTTYPVYFKFTAILLGITLFIYGLVVAKLILIPLTFSAFIASLLTPFCDWQESKKINDIIAAFIAVVSAIIVMAGIMYFFFSQLSNFTNDLSTIEENITELINQVGVIIASWFGEQPDYGIESGFDAFTTFIEESDPSIASNFISAVSNVTLFFMIPVFTFFLLIYRSFIREFFFRAFGTEDDNKMRKIIDNLQTVSQHYLTGMFIVICILAIMNTSMLLAFGINHAVFFGVFAAVLNIIPFIGPLIGSILPILYAFLMTDSLWIPFGILLSFYVIQLIESNVLTPNIVGGQVSINPLVTLLALFIGGMVWGIAGMILFIPGMAILKRIFDEIEGLEPYGYLLGDVQTRKKTRQARFINKQFVKIKDRLEHEA
ncbi:MAG: AI-2E family transporter [Balneolales bacterium]